MGNEPGNGSKSGQEGDTAKLIAIIGGSGSGKSYLAELLHNKLEGRVTRLALDDFYLDRSGSSPARRARINFDHPRAIDWAELEQVLRHLAKGRSVYAPEYDFATHTRRVKRRLVESRPVVLVEGLWPCHRRGLRDLFDLRIYLDCSEATRLRRRLLRDVPLRGRTPESVRQQFTTTVAPMHKKFVAPQRQWSDVVLRRPAAARDVNKLAAKISNLGRSKE